MFATGCGLVGVAALTAVLVAPPAGAAKGPAGSAYALSVATTLLHQPVVKIDPVPTAVYPRGATESLVEVGPNLAGLVTANALNASATLKGRTQHSAASIADVVVKDILSATVISAECSSNGKTLTGEASVADLTVLGQKVDTSIAGAADGVIDVLGLATVRINEQIRKGDSLTVNAVHVTIGGPVGGIANADIVLSQAKCATFDGGTQPPTTTTTTTTTRPTQPPTSTTRPTTTTTSNTTRPTTKTSTTAPSGIDKVSDDSDLAQTGVSAAVPISLAGLVLLAAGGVTMLIARRRRAEKS
jgi:LPXTG-motif cell wall-anchored protein